MNIQITRTPANPQMDRIQNPDMARREKLSSPPVGEGLSVPQDKTTFSTNRLAPATAQMVSLGDEESNMARLAIFSNGESLAAAHSPISYERVMELLA